MIKLSGVKRSFIVLRHHAVELIDLNLFVYFYTLACSDIRDLNQNNSTADHYSKDLSA